MRRRLCLASLMLAAASSIAIDAKPPERSRHAMVVTEEPRASETGIAVLKSGGNAVDAAVAIGFALAVTYPYAGNIGGGGFLTVRMADGRTAFIDFREKAPAKASHDMYLDQEGKVTSESLEGWRAVGVPGTVRGLELAHTKFGTQPWAVLLRPAIQLARDGYSISRGQMEQFRRSEIALAKFPESKRIFLNNGKLWEVGNTMVQPELAAVLSRIAKHGAVDFYEGETAARFAAEMAAHGGLIAIDDLKAYRAVDRKPITGKYKDVEIITAPLPSSGGVGLLQMLGMLEGSGYEREGQGSAATIHYVAEVMRRFYADRSQFFGDSDFYPVPVQALLSPTYISARRATIDRQHATPSNSVRPGKLTSGEGSETTHYAVVDRQGNAVSVTYTLNGAFGSKVTVPGLGFLLNNEMDDFTAKPGVPNQFKLIQGEANAIQPGKRPLSAMTPTIATRNGKLWMVWGGPGGSRIITSVLQVFLNVVDFGQNIQDAIDQPRFHHQWQPDQISLEPGFSPGTIAVLERMGHKVSQSEAASRIEGIAVQSGWLEGGADSRGYGVAQGY